MGSLVARARQIIEFLRKFPLTAPAVAAVDTIVRVLHGNVSAFLAEPWVVASAIYVAVQESNVDHHLNQLGWKGWVGAYLLAAQRYFTSPVHENPA